MCQSFSTYIRRMFSQAVPCHFGYVNNSYHVNYILVNKRKQHDSYNKLYLEYIIVGMYNNMNEYGKPPAKISRHPLKKYNIGPQRPRKTETTEQMSMLNVDKTKTYYDKAITKYYKSVNINLPRLPVYKYLTGIHLKSTENYLGLRTMLYNFSMFLVE